MKIIIAVVISSILAVSSADASELYNKDGNKIDLYGKVDARHTFTDTKEMDGDTTYVRLGFKGETQFNENITGYGQWEYNIEANKAEQAQSSSATRLAYAGVKLGKLGSLDYGRNNGIIYDVESYTDVTPVFGGDSYSTADNFMTGRSNGLATYRNSDFFGFVNGFAFAIQYQGANGNKGENTHRSNIFSQNGDGWGSSVAYSLPSGFSYVAAYSNSHRTGEQRTKTANDARHAETYAIGLKYDENNIYLATNYADTKNTTAVSGKKKEVTDRTRNFEVVAQYQFDTGIRPSVAFLQSKAEKNGHNFNQVKYIEAGASFYINKNMSIYGDYKINLLNSNDYAVKELGVASDDIIGMGAVYQF
ncbi:TPA: porin [Salmonella enterica subsp. enterica serovar Muenchen]|nr:porin [Salmonella enterica subsp. enterica serovar Muenchen]HEC8860545.1 porin [Salmonella enterica subsp. enterica serovar Muenchen]